MSLLETVFGVLTLGSAVVAQMYNAGNTNALSVLHKFEGGNLAGLLNSVFGAGVLLALLASIAYGIAIWRAGVFPKWSAIVFGIGFVLLASSAPFSSLPGGIIMAVACFIMARSLGRHSVAADATRVQPV
jgi:hypothetical protein